MTKMTAPMIFLKKICIKFVDRNESVVNLQHSSRQEVLQQN